MLNTYSNSQVLLTCYLWLSAYDLYTHDRIEAEHFVLELLPTLAVGIQLDRSDTVLRIEISRIALHQVFRP